VAPGFDFDDFKMPGREELVAAYPRNRALIERLTWV
jgi:predicted cupin superfamily sugar epimerase